MERFTVQELRDLATQHHLSGRSKYTKKADLYAFLQEKLGDNFPGNVEREDFPSETTNQGSDGDNNTPDDSEEEESSGTPTLRCITTLDYVVVQSHSTATLFPTIDEAYTINAYICDILGDIEEGIDIVWAISGDKQAPLGLKGSSNSPFKIKYRLEDGRMVTEDNGLLYDEEREEGDPGHYRQDDIVEMWLTPTVSPKSLGYASLLKKYAKRIFFSPHGPYLIEGLQNIVPFCKEVARLSQEWAYVPAFVTDIVQTLKDQKLDADQCLIFRNLEIHDMETLKTYVMEAAYDDIEEWRGPNYLTTHGGLHIAYFHAT